MTATSRHPRIIVLARMGLAIAGGAVLVWGIVTTNLAAQSGRTGNAQLMSVFANGRYPDIAAQLASSFLTAERNDDAVATAREAVRNDPLNVKALSVLGLGLEKTGEKAEATAVMRRASMLGWRNTPTLVWAIQDAAKRDDAVRVVDIADALARRQAVKSLTRTVFFGALMEPRLRQEFVVRLAERPTWRATFFDDVANRLAPAQFDGIETVLRDLNGTAAPPTKEERLKYIGRLTALADYGRARHFWAQAFAIPMRQLAASPFDDRFTLAGRSDVNAPKSPFEWQINPDLDDAISFVAEAGGTALRIEPGLPGGTLVAAQTLMLLPGSHRIMTHLATGEGPIAPVGWQITCQPSKQPLLRTLARNRNDELTEVGVTVPVQGCAAQTLQLTALDRIEAQPVTIDAVAVR